MNTYTSPAKVNLNLKVLGRREDGYHEVSTLMARLDLHDTMTFRKADDYCLKCDYPGVPLDETNLVTKAVRLLEASTGLSFRYEITIDKRIPHGAGLAGGSSNAATTLMALNELEGLALSVEQLAKMGSVLGADVNFFLYQKTCLCSGVGENVEAVDLEIKQEILLVKPNFGVSTPQAYKMWLGAEAVDGVDYSPQPQAWGEMVNDLEMPVFQKFRFLAELKMYLLQQAEVDAAMMSGSGSTVFACLNNGTSDLEQRLRDQLDPTLWLMQTTIIS